MRMPSPYCPIPTVLLHLHQTDGARSQGNRSSRQHNQLDPPFHLCFFVFSSSSAGRTCREMRKVLVMQGCDSLVDSPSLFSFHFIYILLSRTIPRGLWREEDEVLDAFWRRETKTKKLLNLSGTRAWFIGQIYCTTSSFFSFPRVKVQISLSLSLRLTRFLFWPSLSTLGLTYSRPSPRYPRRTDGRWRSCDISLFLLKGKGAFLQTLQIVVYYGGDWRGERNRIGATTCHCISLLTQHPTGTVPLLSFQSLHSSSFFSGSFFFFALLLHVLSAPGSDSEPLIPAGERERDDRQQERGRQGDVKGKRL